MSIGKERASGPRGFVREELPAGVRLTMPPSHGAPTVLRGRVQLFVFLSVTLLGPILWVAAVLSLASPEPLSDARTGGMVLLELLALAVMLYGIYGMFSAHMVKREMRFEITPDGFSVSGGGLWGTWRVGWERRKLVAIAAVGSSLSIMQRRRAKAILLPQSEGAVERLAAELRKLLRLPEERPPAPGELPIIYQIGDEGRFPGLLDAEPGHLYLQDAVASYPAFEFIARKEPGWLGSRSVPVGSPIRICPLELRSHVQPDGRGWLRINPLGSEFQLTVWGRDGEALTAMVECFWSCPSRSRGAAG